MEDSVGFQDHEHQIVIVPAQKGESGAYALSDIGQATAQCPECGEIVAVTEEVVIGYINNLGQGSESRSVYVLALVSPSPGGGESPTGHGGPKTPGNEESPTGHGGPKSPGN